MLSPCSDCVYERGLLVLVEAAGKLGIPVDPPVPAPMRCQVGQDRLVPVGAYQAVMRHIFTQPGETLGLDLARVLPVEKSGLWGFLLHSSRTFGDMLFQAERYIRLVFRDTQLKLTRKGNDATLACIHPDPSMFGRREQEICFFLGQWLTWGRSLVDRALAPKAVRMRWNGPADRAPFERFFGGAVQFGAPDDAMLFDREALALPIRDSTPELTAMFENYAATMIHRMTPQTTFLHSVRQALSEALLAKEASETAVARQLGVTVRTLRRRLAEHQESFRALRSELLCRRAEQLLSESHLPIAEVSYLLGYAEPATFHRAFRRWTGLTPAQWRNQSSEGD